MAEKKKMPAKKTTAPKKAVTKVKPKATTKAKSTSKKTTTRKTAPKKAVAKKKPTTTKKTTPKKVVAKKTVTKKAPIKKKVAAKAVATAPTSILSFADWRKIVGATFKAFKSVFWRIGLVGLMTLMLIGFLAVASYFLIVQLAGSSEALSSQLLNWQLGNAHFSEIWKTGLVAFVFLILSMAIAFLANTSFLLTFKKYYYKKANNPFKNFFVESITFFKRYVWLSIRAAWYLLWPVVLWMLIYSGLITLAIHFGYIDQNTPAQLVSKIVMVYDAIILALLAWRGVPLLFAFASLIEEDSTATEAFHKTKALVKGHWWLIAWSFFLFFVPFILIEFLFNAYGTQVIQGTIIPATPRQQIVDFSSFLFSIFVFAPLSISFVYLTMLHLSKTKKIKL